MSTTVSSVSSQNMTTHHMDVDDTLNNNATNGFSNHGTVSSSSSASSSMNPISNGHSLLDDDSNCLSTEKTTMSNGCLTKSTETLERMECDGLNDADHATENEINSSTIKNDDEVLTKILQFGRELHALKQQLILEYGENSQHDKMLQVDIFYL